MFCSASSLSPAGGPTSMPSCCRRPSRRPNGGRKLKGWCNHPAPGDELAGTAETARRDLDRIFNTGGVVALVGNTYGAAKEVGGEHCANFATKAIAAGLAERTVRVAERQDQLMVELVQAALREVDLSPEQASAF